MDGWNPEDFKLLPFSAYQTLTDMLNCIEGGAAWPVGITFGRLVFLAKDPKDTEQPLSYRPLLITPHVYRRWAAYRLQTLDSWIELWANQYMFAGIPDRSAEDAWWITSATIEGFQTQGTPFSGASADIMKCFDQVVRPLLYFVLRIAGLPYRILEPYIRYSESMRVHDTIGQGIGHAYQRRCGIPQGCPLSMCFLALLLRPWTVAMERISAIPRILADDLLILTAYIHHCQNMHQAADLTHQILHDMGAQVASSKSFMFSNRKGARKWYRGHIWKHLNTTIQVVTNVRDLGGTINTGAAKSSKVIDERILQAIAVLRKFRHLPHSHHIKATFVQLKVLASALYGIEVAEPSAHLLYQLQTAILEVFGTHSSRACQALAFELHHYLRDLDPHVQQFTRRVAMFRRMWNKHPMMQGRLKEIWAYYKEADVGGTIGSTQQQTGPAPPPARKGRAKWKPSKPMWGPIGLMLYSIHLVAGATDSQFRLHQHGLAPVDILNMPHQQVVPTLSTIATDARMEYAKTQRSDLQAFSEIDREVLQGALKGRDEEDTRILKHCMSLSAWANDKLFEAGQAMSRACELCDCAVQTTMHLLHECPALHSSRQEACAKAGNINMHDIPRALKLGIPPIMCVSCDDTFWGTPWQQLHSPEAHLGCFGCGSDVHKCIKDHIDRIPDRTISAARYVHEQRGVFEQCFFPSALPCNETPPHPTQRLQ